MRAGWRRIGPGSQRFLLAKLDLPDACLQAEISGGGQQRVLRLTIDRKNSSCVRKRQRDEAVSEDEVPQMNEGQDTLHASFAPREHEVVRRVAVCPVDDVAPAIQQVRIRVRLVADKRVPRLPVGVAGISC